MVMYDYHLSVLPLVRLAFKLPVLSSPLTVIVFCNVCFMIKVNLEYIPIFMSDLRHQTVPPRGWLMTIRQYSMKMSEGPESLDVSFFTLILVSVWVYFTGIKKRIIMTWNLRVWSRRGGDWERVEDRILGNTG